MNEKKLLFVSEAMWIVGIGIIVLAMICNVYTLITVYALPGFEGGIIPTDIHTLIVDSLVITTLATYVGFFLAIMGCLVERSYFKRKHDRILNEETEKLKIRIMELESAPPTTGSTDDQNVNIEQASKD